MAETLKVAVGDLEYTLDVLGGSHVVRGPVQKEFFTEVDRVSAIQEAIGAEVTGVWDEATNEQFATWLRVQQATHMGIEESDGWWGKKSEAALAGVMDPDALKALTELRESGRLAKLTYRTDIHNATWEQVETDVVKAAAAPDASEAERALAATVTGEEPAVAEPVVTSVPPLSYEELRTPESMIISGLLTGAATAAYMANKKPVADNYNGPKTYFSGDDLDIQPADKSTGTRGTFEFTDPDRPIIDAEIVGDTTPHSRSFTVNNIEPIRFSAALPPSFTQLFDGNAAFDVRAVLSSIVPTIQNFILNNEPAFRQAVAETTERLLPEFEKAFSEAAAPANTNAAEATPVLEADKPVIGPKIAQAMDSVEGLEVSVAERKPYVQPEGIAPLIDDTTNYLDTDINTNKPRLADNLTSEMIRAMDYVDPALVPAEVEVDTAARLAVEGNDGVELTPFKEDVASKVTVTEPTAGITVSQRAAIANVDEVNIDVPPSTPKAIDLSLADVDLIEQPRVTVGSEALTADDFTYYKGADFRTALAGADAPQASVKEIDPVEVIAGDRIVDVDSEYLPDLADPSKPLEFVTASESAPAAVLDLEPVESNAVIVDGPATADTITAENLAVAAEPVNSAPKAEGINLTNEFATTASLTTALTVVADEPEVKLSLTDTPDIYRAAGATDLAVLPASANNVAHLDVNLKALHKISDAGVGISDVVIAGTMFGLVTAVSNAADARKISAEMFPLVGSINAYNEGRSAEGEMRWTEDAMGIGFSLVGGVFGGSAGFAATGANPLGGAAGAFGGSLAGMYGSIQLSAWMRDYYRSQGMDIDEGMDAGELTSFLGSLTETYPELFKSVYGLDEVERTKMSVSTMEVVARHSQYTMEGMSSADAFTRIQSEFAQEDAALATEQSTLLDSIKGIEDLTGGVPVEEYLADPEKFSQVYRLYKGLALENPDDAAMVGAADALAKYNDLSLQRTGVQYSELMAGRLIFAAEIAELDKLGPRDEMIAIRYENIIADYDTMSPEDQEKYAWIKEAGDRYARRQELLGDFTDERNAIANTSRALSHIEDDIGHADLGLASITSDSIAAEQGALIAQMGESFPYTAEELRNDPSLIAALEKRFTESQAGGVSDFMSDLFNGGTYEMNPEEFALLEQFKGLEPHRAHQEFLETSPVLDTAGKDNIQMEIYRRLPDEVTPDMPGALRVLVESKQLLLSTEQYFAEFGPEDAQDEIDFLYRRRQYDENITYSEESWYQTFNDVQVRPDRFKEVLDALDIEIENENNAHSVFDYTYKYPESAPAMAPAAL